MSVISNKIDDVDCAVSKRLKIQRILSGLSQADIGQAIGVSIQQVQKYENGVNRISCGKLYKLSQFLQVPVNYFFDGVSDGYANSVQEEQQEYEADFSILDEKALIELVKAFAKIKGIENRHKALSLMQSMLAIDI